MNMLPAIATTLAPETLSPKPVFVVIKQLCIVTLPVTPEIEMPVPPPPVFAPAAVQFVTVTFRPDASSNPMPLVLVGERNWQPFTKIVEAVPAPMRNAPMLVEPQLRKKVMPATVMVPVPELVRLKARPPPAPSRVICVLVTPGSFVTARL